MYLWEIMSHSTIPDSVLTYHAAISYNGKIINGVPFNSAPDNLWMRHGENQSKYQEWEPRFGIDDFIKTEFSTGLCGVLAAAIHARTGWVIIDELEPDAKLSITDGSIEVNGDVTHTYVLNPQGHAVDIYGIHPTMWARTKYSNNKPSGILYSPEHPDHGDVKWANVLLDNFPEHFGLPI